ncbi:MAG: PAS domain-containing protein, partial [Eubacteriaceae bacterium]|nr:PAS domain-containing protein [Eubacteriaceae bacterium]
MTKRIFWHIFVVAVIVLFASVAMIVGALYEYYSNQYITQLKNEAVYISQGMEENNDYLKKLDNKTDNTRITWINSDGVVLYDNTADAAKMENHSNREEFIEALTNGQGESIRYSKTLSEDTLYYAVKLKNGTVLRVSSTKHSVLAIVYGMLKYILLILLATVALSAFLAYRVSKRIVRPLNGLDFDNPEDAVTYEELSPMLMRISKQNKQIHAQMIELERKQHEFSTIIENMKEGLLIVDKKTDILSYNTSALHLLGANEAVKNKSALTLNRSESFRKAIEFSLSGR